MGSEDWASLGHPQHNLRPSSSWFLKSHLHPDIPWSQERPLLGRVGACVHVCVHAPVCRGGAPKCLTAAQACTQDPAGLTPELLS